MAEKSNSRRRRGKREASFLEGVRDLLHQLSADLAEVKSCIKELQMSQPIYRSVLSGEPEAGSWESWAAWHLLEFEGDFPSNHRGVSQTQATHFNINAQTFKPTEYNQENSSFSREVLLAYRHCTPQELQVVEMISASTLADIDGSRSQCYKCRESKEDCICTELFCRRCVRTAEACQCSAPATIRRSCAVCQTAESLGSLFDDVPLQALPDKFECAICGGQESAIDDCLGPSYYLLQGAQPCQTCMRVDAQPLLKECNAACESLHHTHCMRVSENPRDCQHTNPLHMCPSCQRSGDQVCCPDCYLQRQQDDVEDSQDMQPVVKHWEADEVKVWVQVTLKKAHGAVESGAALHDCIAVLDDRWNAARCHIAAEHHASILDILGQLRESTRSLHAKCSAIRLRPAS